MNAIILLNADAGTLTAMRAVEDTYRGLSRPLTLEEWDQRPGRTRYVDTVMRLTAGLQ